MGKFQNKSSKSNYKLAPHGSLSTTPHNSFCTTPHGSLSTKPKSLVELAAEKIEQSIKQPAKIPKPSKLTPTLKTLAAKALVKDKINYWENKVNNYDAPIIVLDKKPISIADMRYDEIAKNRVSRYTPNTTFQNLFEERL